MLCDDAQQLAGARIIVAEAHRHRWGEQGKDGFMVARLRAASRVRSYDGMKLRCDLDGGTGEGWLGRWA